MNDANEYAGIIERFLADQNLESITPDSHWSMVNKWLSWYQGKVNDFHNYKVYNGKIDVKCNRKTMGMAKMCCEDWADLLMNEKVKLMIDDKNLSDILDKVLLANDFFVQSNQLIEKTFALGEGAFIEYQTGVPDKPVAINYCNAKMIYPLRVQNGQVIDCAFCWKLYESIYYATIHLQQPDGSYKIINKIFTEGENDKIKYLNLPEGVAEEYTSDVCLFQIITPNVANNIDVDCVRGISVFANSIDELEDVDLKFDSYHNEFKLGRKRIIVNTAVTQFNVDDKGNITKSFDSNDLVFYGLDMGSENSPIVPLESPLRVEEHDKAIQTSLSLFGDSVGFGMNHYTFRDGQTYTNQTQIISSNSKMFRRLKKHEAILEKALIDLVKAIVWLTTKKVTDKDISIDFDDSIIEDKSEKQRQALLEYNAQLIDPVQYFMQTRNMDESTASTFVDKVASRNETEKEVIPEGDDNGEVVKKNSIKKDDE